MKKTIFLLSILLFIIFPGLVKSQSIKENIINPFINAVKENNLKKIADLFVYPISRPSPIPDICSKEELLEKYEIRIDEELKQRIINPDNWEVMGSKGIMLDNGSIWLDNDGYIITKLYVPTSKEKENIKNLIQKDKDTLYPSLQNFERNILFFKTEKGFGRIDLLPRVTKNITEEEKYQYAFWNNGKEISDQPDIILKNGFMTGEGNPGSERTGRNERYIFKSGTYTYSFNLNNIARNDMNYRELNIYKNNELIVSYPAEIFK